MGSKSRKGFGCLQLAGQDGMSLERCKEVAKQFRDGFGVNARAVPQPQSPALESMLPVVEVPTPWTDPWDTLDQLGFSSQAYAKKFKHRLEKKALGLPRRIGAPASGGFRSNLTRHSSPVHHHVARASNGSLTFRVVAFPAARLPDFATSKAFLQGYLAHLAVDLPTRVSTGAPPVPAPPVERAEETWTGCHVRWDRGQGRLEATSPGKPRAHADGDAAHKVLAALPSDVANRLKNQGLERATVRVAREGNNRAIISVST